MKELSDEARFADLTYLIEDYTSTARRCAFKGDWKSAGDWLELAGITIIKAKQIADEERT